MAGPAMTADWVAAELLAIARAKSSRGTSDGSSAAIAGIWNARAAPTMKISAKIDASVIQPWWLPSANPPAAQASTIMHACNTRRRSKRSAA